MVHLCVMRDCKSLYCCHKHKLPGAPSAPAAIHLQYVNTYTNTPPGATATDHVYRQELVWLRFYLRGRIFRFCLNLSKVGNVCFCMALAINQSDCCYDVFSLWFSVCLACFVANVKCPHFSVLVQSNCCYCCRKLNSSAIKKGEKHKNTSDKKISPTLPQKLTTLCQWVNGWGRDEESKKFRRVHSISPVFLSRL